MSRQDENRRGRQRDRGEVRVAVKSGKVLAKEKNNWTEVIRKDMRGCVWIKVKYDY